MRKSLILALFFTILISACATLETITTEYPLEGPYLVTKVVDGDTADVIINGTTERLRFSGINTPETDECFYQEATDKLSELILDKEIYLQRDISNKGNYGRLLRYIYIDDLLVNEYLVEQGYAKCYHKYKDDTSKYYQLAMAEAEAIRLNLGLWAECKY
jgi:micrococcal nuclease